MRLALISPKGVGLGDDGYNKRTSALYGGLYNIESLKELMSCPNAPLLTIAAMAAPYFDEIEYIDEEVQTLNLAKEYDIVGMSFMTQQATRAYELADHYRGAGVYTICGGMHPTNLPEQTLEHFDTVFVGECETTWHEFLKDYRRHAPARVYANRDVIDLQGVSMPEYSLLDMSKYRSIPVQISRGCPHNCAFCASTKVYGSKYRHKSVKQVVDEIEAIQAIKCHPQIYFTDDNMLVEREFSSSLLSALRPLGVRWMTHTDVSIADDEKVLSMLYNSGCRKVVIGFESIEPASLSALEKWKFRRLGSYVEAIERIQAHGIGVWGTFIVGLDGDDTTIFQRVVDFALENKLYGTMVSVPTPFPGSDLYRQLEREDRILTKRWSNYTLWNVVVKPSKMTVQELEEGFAYTLKSIYSPEATRMRMNHFKDIYGKR